MKKNALDMLVLVLLIVGGLNWLLTAFNYNVVELAFGAGTVAKIVYGLVGLSALYKIFTFNK